MPTELERLASIEGKLDNIESAVLDVKKLLKEQNGRIRSLENWRNYILGIAVIGAPFVWEIVRRFFGFEG